MALHGANGMSLLATMAIQPAQLAKTSLALKTQYRRSAWLARRRKLKAANGWRWRNGAAPSMAVAAANRRSISGVMKIWHSALNSISMSAKCVNG